VYLERISQMLNERLSGLTLQQIRDTFQERVRDVQNEESGLIRLFIDSADKIFSDATLKDKLHISGTTNIISQPEFFLPQNFRSVIELLNDEEMIVHVLEIDNEAKENKSVSVALGEEFSDERFHGYGVVTSKYTYGDVAGRIGVIGPKRMNYARVVPLVEYLAASVSKLLS